MLDLAAEGFIVAGNVVPPWYLSFSPLNVPIGAVAHPAFLEESHFEKITRTLDPLHPFIAMGSQPHDRSSPTILLG